MHPRIIRPIDEPSELHYYINSYYFYRESYPPTVYYNESGFTQETIKRENDIGPTVMHVYYLTNRGPATIQEAEIFLLWPSTTVGGKLSFNVAKMNYKKMTSIFSILGEDLLYLLDQPHTKGNVKCDAADSNNKHYEVSLLPSLFQLFPLVLRKIFNLSHLRLIKEKTTIFIFSN